jgi:SAM-dependent methyltransferase
MPGQETPPVMPMMIRSQDEGPLLTDFQLVERLSELDGQEILELGCGAARLTRMIAMTGYDRSILALEVDRIQHEKNLALSDLPNVRFVLAGAEAIPLNDESQDVVLMFKSLHHVPLEHMATALREIVRVLRPGGRALIFEPVYAGDFNEIMRLFHDERLVREAAFAAVREAVARGLFELREQFFFRAPMFFADFSEFDQRIFGATYNHFQLSSEIKTEVQERFEAHLTKAGVSFAQPLRLDLLQKPRLLGP